ncbi:MFS transporter [Hahella sp. CCB-MM4]|uniref:MFS transporter n=1 Tax=Hahella sp. (strain CCB-MM4) TaxID=1926491 RepID=UPI000B9AC2D8|nr:MFS transporter [Hahella sp. CCB-MM4]OZG70935.1 MFS transporter [Hahella sp. CCB-MM4]
MKSTNSLLPAEKRSVSILASLYAMRMLGLFMVLPVFMVEGQSLQGANPTLLGLAIGVYGLSQAVLQIPFGILSDKLGRKKMIFIGLVLFALGSVVAASSSSIYGVIVGRVLQGAGAIASVLMALLSDLTREENRTKAMATVGMTIGLSFAVALVLGPILTASFGLSGVFWVTAGLAVVGMLLLTRVPQAVQSKRHLETQVVTGSLSSVFGNKELMRLNWGIFSLHLVMTALFVAIPISLLNQFGFEKAQHGYFYLAVIFGAFVSMVPLIIIGEKRRQIRRFFQGAVLLLTVALLAEIWGMTGFISFTLLLFCFFVAFNYLEATLPSLVSKVAPAGMRGTAMGVYSSSQFLGAFLGGTLGGVAYDMGGLAAVYGLCATIGLVWTILTMSMPEPPYTTSLVLPLRPFEHGSAEQVSQQLGNIPGVQDVTLVVEEHLAYLKIDRKCLDEEALYKHPLAARAEG